MHEYYKKLLKTVEQHAGFISFDVFDTLIIRKVLEPSHVFEFNKEKFGIRGNWRQFRIESEHFIHSVSGINYTLDDLYRYIGSFPYFTDKVEALKQSEIEHELELCIAHPTLKKVFEHCIELKKPIVILSDMYLPQWLIEKILKKNGYEGYEKLYVSSENGVSKHEGDIYPFLCKELQCKPSDILHIGDNEHADVFMAKKTGLKTFHTPSLLSLAKKNPVFLNLYDQVFLDTEGQAREFISRSLYLGFVVSQFSNFNAFPSNKEGFSWVNLKFGPIFYAFSKFLADMCEEKGYERIWLQARDMKYPQKWFDHYLKISNRKPIENHYFYCNRKIINALHLGNKKNIDRMLDLFIYFFHFSHPTIWYFGKLLQLDSAQYLSYLDEYNLSKDDIIFNVDVKKKFAQMLEEKYSKSKQIQDSIKLFKEYLESIGGVNNTVLVDLGGIGRSHGLLNQFIEQEGMPPLPSHLLVDYGAYSVGWRTTSWLTENADKYYGPFSTMGLTEFILCSNEPSILGIEKTVSGFNPVYGHNATKAIPQFEKKIEAFHEGVLGFFSGYTRWLQSPVLNSFVIGKDMSLFLLKRMADFPDKEDASFFNGAAHTDMEFDICYYDGPQNYPFPFKRFSYYKRLLLPWKFASNRFFLKEACVVQLSPIEKGAFYTIRFIWRTLQEIRHSENKYIVYCKRLVKKLLLK